MRPADHRLQTVDLEQKFNFQDHFVQPPNAVSPKKNCFKQSFLTLHFIQTAERHFLLTLYAWQHVWLVKIITWKHIHKEFLKTPLLRAEAQPE